jgi:hypothetical protein
VRLLGSRPWSCAYSAIGQPSDVFRQREVVTRKLLHGLDEVSDVRCLVFIPDHLGGMTTHGITDTLLDTSTCCFSFEGVTLACRRGLRPDGGRRERMGPFDPTLGSFCDISSMPPQSPRPTNQFC